MAMQLRASLKQSSSSRVRQQEGPRGRLYIRQYSQQRRRQYRGLGRLLQVRCRAAREDHSISLGVSFL
jgi:hypothetical protein